MSHRKLAEVVVQFIEFLELTDNEQFDSRMAVKQQESIAAHLAEATDDERAAVMQAARSKLASLLREPDEFGYSPLKTVSAEHRALLESIASGEAFGWSPGGAT